MLKILIVEEDTRWQRSHQRDLSDRVGGKILIIKALTIQKAEEHFVANPDIAAIVVSPCVCPCNIQGQPVVSALVKLVKKFRKTFSGPIIVATSVHFQDWRLKLRYAGCSHKSEKSDLPQELSEILRI